MVAMLDELFWRSPHTLRYGVKPGRQSQPWMKTPEGWRVVAAHVSLLA